MFPLSGFDAHPASTAQDVPARRVRRALGTSRSQDVPARRVRRAPRTGARCASRKPERRALPTTPGWSPPVPAGGFRDGRHVRTPLRRTVERSRVEWGWGGRRDRFVRCVCVSWRARSTSPHWTSNCCSSCWPVTSTSASRGCTATSTTTSRSDVPRSALPCGCAGSRWHPVVDGHALAPPHHSSETGSSRWKRRTAPCCPGRCA